MDHKTIYLYLYNFELRQFIMSLILQLMLCNTPTLAVFPLTIMSDVSIFVYFVSINLIQQLFGLNNNHIYISYSYGGHWLIK